MPPRYGTGVRGYFRDFVQFRTESIQLRTESVQFCTESIRVHTSKVLGVFLFIYLIDVNLNYYQNNSRLSVDVGKLPNHIKSVSQFSLDLFLFNSILFIIIVHGYNMHE
jgi:hypothetical protein